MRSTRPWASRRPAPMSSSWYLIDDEPLFSTSTCGPAVSARPRARSPMGGLLCLDGGDGDRVDDVAHGGAAGQVVDGPAQALQHRAHGDRSRAALDRLVEVVAGVEIGYHEDGGPPGDVAAGHLRPGDPGVGGGVVL